MNDYEIINFWRDLANQYDDYDIFVNIVSKLPAIDFSDKDKLNRFCSSKKLSFCDYCEPMCEIYGNCESIPDTEICDNELQLKRPLVQTCCQKCSSNSCAKPIEMSLPSHIWEDPGSDRKLLHILLPTLLMVALLSVTLGVYFYRKSGKTIKCKPLCQFKIESESDNAEEVEDRTEISITELWERIKNNDDKEVRPNEFSMRPTENNAPMACVLRSNSEV